MPSKSTISTVCLALYFRGLALYFCLAGIVGIHTTVLTAIFQISLLVIPFTLILKIEECRKKLLKFELIDGLYVVLLILYLLDLKLSPPSAHLKENTLIYFAVSWIGLFLAKSLTFNQFKTFFYTTHLISVATSFILLAQVFTGTASYVDNGGRLVAGSSGNPIFAGYTGAYAFLTSLTLWIIGTSPRKNIWLLTSVPGLMVSTFSGTRSATLSIGLGGIFLAVYTLRILFSSNRTTLKFISNAGIVCALALSAFLIFTPGAPTPVSGVSSTTNTVKNYEADPVTKALNRVEILSTVASGGKGDASIEGRRTMYDLAWQGFMKNPVLGNGVYSVGDVHNAWLQVCSEFGVLGIITFILPFIYLGYRVLGTAFTSLRKLDPINAKIYPERFLKSDYSMMICFSVINFIQTFCLFSFHGSPYTNNLPICSLGVFIAFLRLDKESIKTQNQ